MIRYIILLVLPLFFLLSCDQDIEFTPEADSDLITTTFRMSMDQGLATYTDYEPMRAFAGYDNGTKVFVTNLYRVFIMKEVGTKWIIDKILTLQIDPDDIYNNRKYAVKDNSIIHSFSTDLRPGNYRMSIFTGYESLRWNNALREGTVVGDSSDPSVKAPWACTYRTVAQGYIHGGWRCLNEEIFSKTISFVVEKTEDLHSGAIPREFFVNLQRKVTRLRILLKYEQSSAGLNFLVDEPNSISADIKTLGGKPLCAGLDILGQPFYENPLYGLVGEDEYITNMKYVVSCWRKPEAPLRADDGNDYILGMHEGARQYSPFYFSDPNNDNIPVEISCVEVLGSQRCLVIFMYAYPEANSTEDPVKVVLKHNSIYGLIFKPGNNLWEDPRVSYSGGYCVNMVLETDSDMNPIDGRTIFDDFFEYRTTQMQP